MGNLSGVLVGARNDGILVPCRRSPDVSEKIHLAFQGRCGEPRFSFRKSKKVVVELGGGL